MANKLVKDLGVIERGKGRRYSIKLYAFENKWGKHPYYTIQEQWETKNKDGWRDFKFTDQKNPDGTPKKYYAKITVPAGLINAFIVFLQGLDVDGAIADCAVHEDIKSGDPF